MPWTLKTKDGITINNIPDDITPEAHEAELRARVDKERGISSQPIPTPAPERPQERVQGEGALSQIPNMERSYMDALAAGRTSEAMDIKRRIEGRIEQGEEGDIGIGSKILEAGKTLAFKAKGKAKAAKEAVTGEAKQTELTQSIPELTSLIAKGNPAGFGPKVRLGLVDLTAKSEGDRIAKLKDGGAVIFPDSKGNPIGISPNGTLFLVNKPGISRTDIESFAGKAALFGKASSLSGGGVLGQMTGAMGTQTALEAGSHFLGGEFEGHEIALAGIFEGLGVGLGKVVGRAVSKMKPTALAKIDSYDDLKPYLSKEEFSKLKKLKETEKGLGVSDSESVLGPQFKTRTGQAREEARDIQRAVQDVENAEAFGTRTAKQDVFSDKKLREQIESIPSGDGDALDFGLTRVRKASGAILDKLDSARKGTAKKLFGETFKANNQVNLRPIREKIKLARRDGTISGGDLDAVEKKVLGFMQTKEGINYLTMKGKLSQQLGWEIDNLIRGRGETSVGNNAKKFLIDLKKTLTDEIDKTNKGFKAANKKYSEQTRDIDEIEEGIVGLISGKKDVNQSSIVSNIFNDKNLSAIRRLKGTLDQSDPAAFQALYKGWIKGRIDKLPHLADDPNRASTVYKEFFGTPDKVGRMMELAPSPEFKKNLMWLKDYLGYAKGFRLPSAQSAGGDIIDIAAQTTAEASVNPIAAAARRGRAIWDNRRAGRIMEAMLNPKWAEEMKFLRSVNKARVPDELEKIFKAMRASGQATINAPDQPESE